MNRMIEAGVFIPTGTNGWITSTNAPYTPGTYDHVLQVTQLAEELGFDFVLSPANWRGRRGPSRHWVDTTESLTTSAALLQATDRINVWATAHVTVIPPQVIAKMIGTLDQIGPGRVGLNVVTGPSVLDLSQLGLGRDDLQHDEKYDLAEEAVQIMRQLWTDPVSNFRGKYFHTDSGKMDPKPSKRPTLVNAGASSRGFQFAAEQCDVAFTVISDSDKFIEGARRAKVIAAERGCPGLRVFGLTTVIPGATDAEAEERKAHFEAGVDVEALIDAADGYKQKESSEQTKAILGGEKNQSPFLPGPLVGSPETIARKLAHIVTEADLDGVMIVVPDYLEDLAITGREILPLMTEFGVDTAAGSLTRALS